MVTYPNNNLERPLILLVDDQPENLHLLIDILRDDYAITVATNGEKALSIARSDKKPKIILLDILMPQMDGYSVLSALKIDPETADIPVIFVTSLDKPTDEALGLKLGVADYITKPINAALLKKRIDTQLRLRHAQKDMLMLDAAHHYKKNKQQRLLLVDDQPENIHHLIDVLQINYQIQVARTGKQALELIQDNPPDLILLDIVMPDMDGFTVCQHIKRSTLGNHIPVIFITIMDNAADKVKGFNAGGVDYITKPFNSDEILARIRTHLELSRLRRLLEDTIEQRTTMLQLSEEKYSYITHRDPLTNLPNRAFFMEQLVQSIETAKIDKKPLALLAIDIDNFQSINESLGHLLGDTLIISVAHQLQKALPSTTIARIGGDEFALIIERHNHTLSADLIAQNLIDAIAQPLKLGEVTIYPTVSIGISVYPQDADSAEHLHSHADVALHKAKKQSIGSIHFFSPAMSQHAKERLTLEAELRHAIDQQEFIPFYQPQVDLTTGKIIGLEALIRWQHPTRGLISPNDFIPFAEESGLIVAIGDWMLRRVCIQVAEWNKLGICPQYTAVNVSALQLERGDIVQKLKETLSETQINPAQLELEITESAMMLDPEKSQKTLCALKKLGTKFSIDDFGTGYSSMAYLQKLSVHKLKIDISFIRNMTENNNDANIVKAIIALGHGLDLDVIAEGVEYEAQANLLKHLGCDQIQGYLIGKPMPSEAITAQLMETR
jgi:diguanylate cyclase (GGDEF)-like protein